jgi:hypothetical protein
LSPPPPQIANAADAEDALDGTLVMVGCHKVHGAAKQGKNSANPPMSSIADACAAVVVIVAIVVFAFFIFILLPPLSPLSSSHQKRKEWRACKQICKPLTNK